MNEFSILSYSWSPIWMSQSQIQYMEMEKSFYTKKIYFKKGESNKSFEVLAAMIKKVKVFLCLADLSVVTFRMRLVYSKRR
jgi:hypothetical protein